MGDERRPIGDDWLLRKLGVLSVVVALSTPRLAHAADISGLVQLALAMLLGAVSALVLVVLIIASLIRKRSGPRPAWARNVTIASGVLGLIYPASMVLLGADRELVTDALLWNLPVLVLAVVSIVLARRLAA